MDCLRQKVDIAPGAKTGQQATLIIGKLVVNDEMKTRCADQLIRFYEGLNKK